MGTIIELRTGTAGPRVAINGKVPPRRRPNAEVRGREYLEAHEVEKLRRASRRTRYPARDEALILIAYRHGLRVAELVDLRWDAVDLEAGRLHVTRVKRGTPAVHPLQGDTMRLLRRLRATQGDAGSPFVFASERGAAMTTANVRKLVARLAAAAKLGIKAHPHMFRHACGYKLVNSGQDSRAIQLYLGHKNIQSTTVYTHLTDAAFKGFWRG
jgi:type 1 fimbriae regulatory protein FimB/type 1 fimbriae regulatory protein FimE